MLTLIRDLSIKTKLTLVYSLVVCFVLLLFVIVIYRSVINNLEREVDSDLAQRAEQARVYFASSGFNRQDLDNFASQYGGGGSAYPRATSGPNQPPLRSGTMPEQDSDLSSALTYLQLVDSKGEVLQRQPPNLRVMAQPKTREAFSRVLSEGAGYNYIELPNGERARVYTIRLDRVENKGYIQVARSLQETDTIIKSLISPLVIASGLAFFLLGIFGWWITRRTLNPIEDVTATAYRISVNDNLSERITTNPSSNDEVSRLGRAFNAMLDRVEKNFKAQKQFIADSSHELRTPLTVIRGNIDLLKRNPDPQNQAESLQAIERESARMQRLVQDLLLLAQADARQTVELVPVQLHDIVLEVFKEMRILADQRHQQLKLGKFDPVLVEGDPDRLKRALLNLVDNAIKYTPEEGEITIALIEGKQWAQITVSDNGPGIAEKDQALIFDRFYRVDRARSRSSGGSGLGLAIVKHIVEAHGGRISLKSEPGNGSTFTIWLKRVASPDFPLDLDAEDEPEDSGQPDPLPAAQPQITRSL